MSGADRPTPGSIEASLRRDLYKRMITLGFVAPIAGYGAVTRA